MSLPGSFLRNPASAISSFCQGFQDAASKSVSSQPSKPSSVKDELVSELEMEAELIMSDSQEPTPEPTPVRPQGIRNLRKFATSLGIKNAGRMNLAQLDTHLSLIGI